MPNQQSRPADPALSPLLHRPWYWYYVLAVFFLSYVVNVMDRSSVLALSLQGIKREFSASDFQLGLLGGIPFAIFYATLGIPIAAWADRSNRRNVLSIAVAVWSGMTVLCGMAVNFGLLFAARVGTAIGEAGGSPPSHSLISDYFPKSRRGTAFAIFALGVPFGTAMGNYIGGWVNQHYGWRQTFFVLGLPGLLIALLVRFTVIEPPRGLGDNVIRQTSDPPPIPEVLRFLWRRASFRHLSLGTALHSVAWYAGSQFNAPFLIRSHQMTTLQAGNWLAVFALVGGCGTFLGGFAADRLSARTKDRRWYLWVPGAATMAMVPFQFFCYLSPNLNVALPAFAVMMFLAAVFFGPSFTMTQALATLRMRSVATSLLLFVQTLIGFGLGPASVGRLSDWLMPSRGVHSLRYALFIVGLVNIWAAVHYMWGTRTLRQDLRETEMMESSGI